MARVRFFLFASYWMGWTALFLAPLAVFALAGAPTRPIRAATRLWARGILFGLRRFIGLDYVEEGRGHIPSEPCLFVANHQSAWETLAFLVLVPDVAIIASASCSRSGGRLVPAPLADDRHRSRQRHAGPCAR